jgi:hypothetical protein
MYRPMPEIVTDPLVHDISLDTEDMLATTAIPPVDELLSGLRAGTITTIDSSDPLLFTMVNMLCVNFVREWHKDVIWVDGGNSVNPYDLTYVCKRFRLRPESVLSSINVSRAFTAYQMSTLVEESLEEELVRCHGGMVMISCYPDLFQDADMDWEESLRLMTRGMGKLRSLTEKHRTVTVVTNYGLAKLMYRKGLRPLFYDGVDRVVSMEHRSGHTRVSLPKEEREIMYRPVSPNQTTLDEYRRR